MKSEGSHVGLSSEQFCHTYTVDTFSTSLAVGQQKLARDVDPRDYFGLRLDDDDVVALRSKYTIHRHDPLGELERWLSQLSRVGTLHSSVMYFGVSTDPLHPFEGKFDLTMKFLDLFAKYPPGHLVIQTRSPLLVIALPALQRLGRRVTVTMGIETNKEDVVRRYTPGLPRIEERLKAATALRRFGLEVTLQVNPVLPYGEWREDAHEFAELLTQHADYVHVRPFSDGQERTERRLKTNPVVRKLAQDRKFHWLRPDAANPLITEIEKLAPEKLAIPCRRDLLERQLGIFAA